MSASLTGANGGFVVCSADDPSMHSSQNEQDSRFYAQFALIPCFEPADHQEAYDMTREAFDLSESLGLPVMLRLTTRLSHSRAGGRDAARRGRRTSSRRGPGPAGRSCPANARVRFERAPGAPGRAASLCRGLAVQPARASTRTTGAWASSPRASATTTSWRTWTGCGDARPRILKIGVYPHPRGPGPPPGRALRHDPGGRGRVPADRAAAPRACSASRARR